MPSAIPASLIRWPSRIPLLSCSSLFACMNQSKTALPCPCPQQLQNTQYHLGGVKHVQVVNATQFVRPSALHLISAQCKKSMSAKQDTSTFRPQILPPFCLKRSDESQPTVPILINKVGMPRRDIYPSHVVGPTCIIGPGDPCISRCGKHRRTYLAVYNPMP